MFLLVRCWAVKCWLISTTVGLAQKIAIIIILFWLKLFKLKIPSIFCHTAHLSELSQRHYCWVRSWSLDCWKWLYFVWILKIKWFKSSHWLTVFCYYFSTLELIKNKCSKVEWYLFSRDLSEWIAAQQQVKSLKVKLVIFCSEFLNRKESWDLDRRLILH